MSHRAWSIPDKAEHIRAKLEQWGGNASGVNVANIDNLGNVHPDTMWWHHALGSVRERKFADIWQDTTDPLMAGLKAKPRRVSGHCAQCSQFDICGGNTRVRAQQVTGNPWAEDPGCYLDDDEIGLPPQAIQARVEAAAAGGLGLAVALHLAPAAHGSKRSNAHRSVRRLTATTTE